MFDVTVLMPTYNSSRTLLKAVQSVVDCQPGLKIQLVIVDDASTDAHQLAMLHDLQKHGSRSHVTIQTMCLPEGRGTVGALNAAMAIAQGRYWIKLDSDDWFEPACLPKMVDVLDENLAIGFVYGCCQFHENSAQYYKPPVFEPGQFLVRNAAIGEVMWRGPEAYAAGVRMRGFREQDGRQFGPHDWDHVLQMIYDLGWSGMALQHVLVLHYMWNGVGASAETQRHMAQTLAAFQQQWPQLKANSL